MKAKITTEIFIKKCKEIYGEKYDYSKVNYINSQTKVCVICHEKDENGEEHGEFWVTPNNHLRNRKCPKCKLLNLRKRFIKTTEQFIEDAIKIHGDKYDYSKVEYINNKTKVCIICHEKDKYGVEHGEFWQRPNDHLTGYECRKCKNKHIPTTEEWVTHANIVHEGKYDYSKVNYVNASTKVCIICPIHGEFWQTPPNHMNGANCPHCNSDNKSKMEENIHILLEQHNIKHERQKTFQWLKYKRNLFLDFYIPYKKIGIEVQGEQHFVPVQRFGGEEFFKQQQERDKIKKKLCKQHNVKLFYITKRNYNIDEIIKYLQQK